MEKVTRPVQTFLVGHGLGMAVFCHSGHPSPPFSQRGAVALGGTAPSCHRASEATHKVKEDLQLHSHNRKRLAGFSESRVSVHCVNLTSRVTLLRFHVLSKSGKGSNSVTVFCKGHQRLKEHTQRHTLSNLKFSTASDGVCEL